MYVEMYACTPVLYACTLRTHGLRIALQASFSNRSCNGGHYARIGSPGCRRPAAPAKRPRPQKCTNKGIWQQGIMSKPRSSFQHRLCPVVVCPHSCRSDDRGVQLCAEPGVASSGHQRGAGARRQRRQHLLGWHHLSTAACVMRPR